VRDGSGTKYDQMPPRAVRLTDLLPDFAVSDLSAVGCPRDIEVRGKSHYYLTLGERERFQCEAGVSGVET
jgi:hypothetical protein